jgi:hypothetical protein
MFSLVITMLECLTHQLDMVGICSYSLHSFFIVAVDFFYYVLFKKIKIIIYFVVICFITK